ncbi:hypothetical protein ACFOMD_10835 [Sphingoaurantiacus capsulatus]|uniref:DUF2946 domain-containing protein n=1 Tax=Sphingoaurantiacus capsulatus TaxID=1771310 RepID=A0ABV7XAA6_9SPHN
MLSRWLLICALAIGLVFGQSTMAAAMTVSATAASDHCSGGSEQSDEQTPAKQMRCGSCAAVEIAAPRPIARIEQAAALPARTGPAPLADLLPDHDTPPPRLAV